MRTIITPQDSRYRPALKRLGIRLAPRMKSDIVRGEARKGVPALKTRHVEQKDAEEIPRTGEYSGMPLDAQEFQLAFSEKQRRDITRFVPYPFAS